MRNGPLTSDIPASGAMSRCRREQTRSGFAIGPEPSLGQPRLRRGQQLGGAAVQRHRDLQYQAEVRLVLAALALAQVRTFDAGAQGQRFLRDAARSTGGADHGAKRDRTSTRLNYSHYCATRMP